jgi:hypothetical protein
MRLLVEQLHGHGLSQVEHLLSSTAQNPTVTYNTAGTYSVTLTATGGTGVLTLKSKRTLLSLVQQYSGIKTMMATAMEIQP